MKNLRIATSLALIPLLIILGGWACNVQSTVDRINSILAEVGPAIQIVVSLLPLLGSKNIPADVVAQVNAWVPRIQGDVTQLGGLITQYQSDLTSVDAEAKINAMISTTEQDITGILPIFRVLDSATQQKVTAIVTAIAAAVVSVENIINAAKGVRNRAGTPLISSGKDFKNKFNAVLHAPTGDSAVDGATAQLGLK